MQRVTMWIRMLRLSRSLVSEHLHLNVLWFSSVYHIWIIIWKQSVFIDMQIRCLLWIFPWHPWAYSHKWWNYINGGVVHKLPAVLLNATGKGRGDTHGTHMVTCTTLLHLTTQEYNYLSLAFWQGCPRTVPWSECQCSTPSSRNQTSLSKSWSFGKQPRLY